MCCLCSVCVCLSVRVVFHCQELLNRKLSRMPSSEEATMVTWEELEQAITDGWKVSQTINKGRSLLSLKLRSLSFQITIVKIYNVPMESKDSDEDKIKNCTDT